MGCLSTHVILREVRTPTQTPTPTPSLVRNEDETKRMLRWASSEEVRMTGPSKQTTPHPLPPLKIEAGDILLLTLKHQPYGFLDGGELLASPCSRITYLDLDFPPSPSLVCFTVPLP